MISLKNWVTHLELAQNSSQMPVLFVGHGNPMNAVEDNEYTRGWKLIGQKMERPKAILVISAHWLTRGTFVTVMPKPRTIHDFRGFPDKLFAVQYPAPGSPELAEQVKQQIELAEIILDHEWGLDHGTWSVLAQMFPNADVPVFQLSIDYTKPASWHYELAKELTFLRSKGVLIIGSGNVVHNLHLADFHGGSPYDWASEFDQKVKNMLAEGDHRSLIEYEKLGKEALLSIPTTEHYLPLLYTIGLQQQEDHISFPVEGMDLKSISMRTVLFNS
ncbi:4,5-DOPA-extradiol-dioxygenase [Solitalea koreensis]|uniref:4,5-DOPA dioxygenase extradiol n=1 Tax=Solitalea koreensis TaxID=543615 RepID=A0A521D9Y6_9SPHI|nr:4,5-DOPA dioxygenase extradiol [Solitalea koreensis]SMO68524.1 4,5-DOPA dioxygenase extradiol [Solitalea koreensis]